MKFGSDFRQTVIRFGDKLGCKLAIIERVHFLVQLYLLMYRVARHTLSIRFNLTHLGRLDCQTLLYSPPPAYSTNQYTKEKRK